jgi:hypothetical protein
LVDFVWFWCVFVEKTPKGSIFRAFWLFFVNFENFSSRTSVRKREMELILRLCDKFWSLYYNFL